MIRILWILAFTFCSAYSSSYNYQTYHFEDGLPTNLTKVVIQDSLGFIWVGTDAGLVRFNGKNFESFNEGLPSLYIKDLVPDKGGKVFVVTDQGISILYPGYINVKIEPFLDGSAKIEAGKVNYPKTIYRDSKNRLWISEPRSVALYDSNGLQHFVFDRKHETQSYLKSFHYFEDKNNVLYLTSQRGWLMYFNEQIKQFEEIPFPQTANKNYIFDDLEKVDENLFLVVGESSLFEIIPDIYNTKIREIEGVGSMQSINKADNGQIIIGTTVKSTRNRKEGSFHFPHNTSDAFRARRLKI